MQACPRRPRRRGLAPVQGTGDPRQRLLLRLPPCSPELNPVETLTSVLKHRHFVNRVFESVEHDRETVEEVSNVFTRKTGEIMQFTAGEWAAL